MKKGNTNQGACEAVHVRLGAWLDGELPAGEYDEVQSHLDRCARCQQVVEEYRRLGGWVRQSRTLEQLQPSAGVFWNRLRGRMPERRAGWLSAWRLGLRPRYQLALVAVVMLAVVALVFFSPGSPVPVVPSEATVASQPGCVVESVETGVPGASLMVYRSEEENLTVVWLFAQNTPASSTLAAPKERTT